MIIEGDLVDHRLLLRLQECTEQQKRPVVVPLLLVIPEKEDHERLVQQGPYARLDQEDGKLVGRMRAWQDHLLEINRSRQDQPAYQVIEMDMDRLPAILDQVQAIILEKITVEMS